MEAMNERVETEKILMPDTPFDHMKGDPRLNGEGAAPCPPPFEDTEDECSWAV